MTRDRIVDAIIIAVIAIVVVTVVTTMRDVCFGGPCPGTPPPAQPSPSITLQSHSTPIEHHDSLVTVALERKAKPEWKCKDKAAKILYAAGFTGWSHQMAWAITWRESRHQNLVPGHPQYNGSDLGMWQINRGAHGDASWWSESAMSDPVQQSRIAYKYLTKKGAYWIPWGHNPDGSLNTSHYSMWSSWHHYNWILAPFQTGLSLYPCKTPPPSKKETA